MLSKPVQLDAFNKGVVDAGAVVWLSPTKPPRSFALKNALLVAGALALLAVAFTPAASALGLNLAAEKGQVPPPPTVGGVCDQICDTSHSVLKCYDMPNPLDDYCIVIWEHCFQACEHWDFAEIRWSVASADGAGIPAAVLA